VGPRCKGSYGLILPAGVGQKLDVCDIVYDTNGLRTAMDAMAARFHGDAYTHYVVLPVQVPHAAATASYFYLFACVLSMSERPASLPACLTRTVLPCRSGASRCCWALTRTPPTA
jgi:hypothetical protein